MNDNSYNKKLNPLLKKNKTILTASKGFAGKQYNRALDEIYRKIRDEKKQIADFDDDALITDIMKSLNVEQKLKKQNISLREHRRKEKKDFIKQYGKLIVELLNPQSGMIEANAIGKKYCVSYGTVYKIIDYLNNKFKIKFQLKSTQPLIEKNSELLNHPTYILIETIKTEIENYLGDKISYQSLARDILNRPENFIAKKYYLIKSGKQGRFSDDVYYDIKSRAFYFFTKNCILIPDHLNKEFKNYEEYLKRMPIYISPLNMTPELSENITYKFFIAIKIEIEKKLGRTLTNREFSKTFLNRHPQFLEDKFGKIRWNDYLGTLMKNLFIDIKANIFNFFTQKKVPIPDELNNIFDEYEDYLILARYIRSEEMSKKYHPQLKSDFFKKIDTREKAYWLGFMFADGFVIVRTNRNNSKTIGITLSIKDENTLDLLINTLGLNVSFKNYFETIRIDKVGVQKVDKYCRINWNHQSMADDLINYGVVPNKSKIIRLPELDNEELYLAFLLGYFDGDGQQGTTRIYSGSKKFLIDIKRKFKIRNEIKVDHRTEYIHPITQKIIKKNTYVYRLALGSNLFNKMLKNYPYSIERKRKIYVKPRKHKEDYITREELDILVWKMPLKNIAEILKITTEYVKKWCDEWEISRPDPSYWPGRTAGKKKIK